MSKNQEKKSKILALITILIVEFPTVAIGWVVLAEKVNSWNLLEKIEIVIPQKRIKAK